MSYAFTLPHVFLLQQQRLQYLINNITHIEIIEKINNMLGIVKNNQAIRDNRSCMLSIVVAFVVFNISVVKLFISLSLSTRIEGNVYEIK